MSRNPESRGPRSFGGRPPEVRVHVLSEHVFCPRAALLALESGDDEGDEEPALGPRLDWYGDYDEQLFVETLHAAWADWRLWFTLMAPALLLSLLVWWLTSPIWGLLAALPVFYLAARLWDTSVEIVKLIRERAHFRAAEPATIALHSQEICEVNWWSLCRAGFDCLKPADSHRDWAAGLVGRPWRILTKDTAIRIPVVRKHRGDRVWRPQHLVRIAAYCRLLEACEGAEAPFGVLLFAGSYDCLIIPNTAAEQSRLDQALEDVREFLRIQAAGKFIPIPPRDNRCSGCHRGFPREYRPGRSDTVLNGEPLSPFLTRAANGKRFHCECGDRFHWVPPHADAIRLGIAEDV